MHCIRKLHRDRRFMLYQIEHHQHPDKSESTVRTAAAKRTSRNSHNIRNEHCTAEIQRMQTHHCVPFVYFRISLPSTPGLKNLQPTDLIWFIQIWQRSHIQQKKIFCLVWLSIIQVRIINCWSNLHNVDDCYYVNASDYVVHEASCTSTLAGICQYRNVFVILRLNAFYSIGCEKTSVSINGCD